MPIEREHFEVDGADPGAWRLTNVSGAELRVAAWGGAILALRVPDRSGRLDDVVLGYAATESYARNPSYLGVLCGRYANRIAGARYVIDGAEHRLVANDGPNQLHGGTRGFSRVAWQIEPFEEVTGVGVALSHVSRDGDEGHPGTLHARVTYTLTDRNELVIGYHATTDRPTHLTLTQHAYFNLAGHSAGDVLRHTLQVDADRFLPIGDGSIPTGELRDVAGTPFDFRTATAIGARIDSDDEQLARGRGYDHCFELRGEAQRAGERLRRGEPLRGGELRGPDLSFAARVVEPASGRTMEVYTSEPGIQLYTGNWLGDGLTGKDGVMYGPRSGFALETQHFPDSPNRPEFPSTLLRPEAPYRSHTVYAFGIE